MWLIVDAHGEPVQVIPAYDLYPHDTAECQCDPLIDTSAFRSVVIHNAWDGRERIERHPRSGEWN